MPKIIKRITIVNETFYECNVTEEQADLFNLADSYTVEQIVNSYTFSQYQTKVRDESVVYFLDSQFPVDPPPTI